MKSTMIRKMTISGIWTLPTGMIRLSETTPRPCRVILLIIALSMGVAIIPTGTARIGYVFRSIPECDVMHHLILIDLLQGPNDETANEQQDVAHHMYYLTLDGRLHLAPLNNPQVWVLRLIAR